MKVLHVTNTLSVGGAETMLYRLVSHPGGPCEAHVVSLTDVGPLGQKLRDQGTSVQALHMRSDRPDPRALVRLVEKVRRIGPDVMHTWLYHADLLGSLAARLVGGLPLVWGVRNDLAWMDRNRRTLCIARACACLSRWLPARIVCSSEAARDAHIALGYDAARMEVIPNGFDPERLCPDPGARAEVRRELGLGPDVLLVGFVGRVHPAKDHATFLDAARRVAGKRGDVHFLLCGPGADPANPALHPLLHQARLGDRVHLLGLRADVPRLTAAFDVACLATFGEGFPNVVGEAMACGVPCVATDVAGIGRLLGPAGRAVPARDPESFAAAILELLALSRAERHALGLVGRTRVQADFSLPAVARRYWAVYAEVAGSA